MPSLNLENFFFFEEDCSKIKILPDSVEHAYLAVLNDDLVSAKEIFGRIDSPRAKWGKVLVSVLKGYLDVYPTYFQIRNFLEIDLDFLIKNEKIDYTEQLLGALEIFVKINYETYKFVARVMYANKLYAAALSYMEKSRAINYTDAELHFMFAKYYLGVHDYIKAYAAVEECLCLIPDYYPAKILKQRIEETCI